MSEQLTIEILKEKFKEAQIKGNALLVVNKAGEDRWVIDIGELYIWVYLNGENLNYEISYGLLQFKIKQPKDEYETLYEYMDEDYRLFLNKYDGLLNAVKTKRKLLRNTRTGEIIEYNEDLLK